MKLLLSSSGKQARKSGRKRGRLFHWEGRLAKTNFLIPFKKEPGALDSHMGAIHLEETCHFAIGFVSGCNNATYHLQQNLQKCCFLSCCYLLLTVQLSKLPHATILLFASVLAEYKTKSACENQELKLHCQESKFLIIYSAIYGRWAHEENVCSTEVERVPPFGMFLHCWLIDLLQAGAQKRRKMDGEATSGTRAMAFWKHQWLKYKRAFLNLKLPVWGRSME